MASTSVKPLFLDVVLSTNLIDAWQPINAPGGFEAAIFFMRIVNDTGVPLFISFDGVNSHEYIPVGGVFELPSQANAQPNGREALFAKNTIVYVNGKTGEAGLVSLSGYYV